MNADRFHSLSLDEVRALLAARGRRVLECSPLHRFSPEARTEVRSNPGVRADAELSESISILCAPRHRIELKITTPASGFELCYYVKDKTAVVVQITSARCEFSTPIPLARIVERLVETVGTSKGGNAPPAIQSHSAILILLNALIHAGMAVYGRGEPLSREMAISAVENARQGVSGAEFVDGLVVDGLAIESSDGLVFTTQFSSWVRAIASGHRLHVRRTIFEGAEPQKMDVLFFGERGQRRVVWPAGRGVILCAPEERRLREMIRYLVVEIPAEAEKLKISRFLRC